MTTPRALDVGCGTRKRPGAIGLDVNPRSDADVVHDLNKFPYPFADSEFDEIYVDNVLEHLDDVIAVLEELHRIGRAGALVKIIVPYFRSRWAYVDPTHRHFFTVESMSYLDPNRPNYHRYDYSLAKFTVERRVFNETLKDGLAKGLLKAIANRRPGAYERFLAHIYPLDDLTFYLRVVK
jgi:ubiquinone/menaquinone biosynthesis C-methylase UbiE